MIVNYGLVKWEGGFKDGKGLVLIKFGVFSDVFYGFK